MNGDFSDPSARRTTYAPSIWRSSCDRRHTAWRERCFSPRSPGSLLERLGWSSQSRDLPALGLVLVLVPLAFPPDRPRKTALMRQRTHALQRAHGSAEPARRRPRDHLLCVERRHAPMKRAAAAAAELIQILDDPSSPSREPFLRAALRRVQAHAQAVEETIRPLRRRRVPAAIASTIVLAVPRDAFAPCDR